MGLDAGQIASLVSSPSLGAVTYQAVALLKQLARINSEEYLPEACMIKEIFVCIAEYILDELQAMYDPSHPFDARGDYDFSRTRALARILHQLHSFLRYLWASSPHQSPPGIQAALNHLTQLHFPKQNGEPICLVRPQWKYNLTYVSMTWILRSELLLSSVLDPNGTLGSSDADAILNQLWKRHVVRRSKEDQEKLGTTPPKQVAILSFAGLDTHDTLLYPLLAHELGHFIDFSYTPQLNVSPAVSNAAQIKEDEVRQILQQHLGSNVPAQDITAYHKILVQRVFVALREIIADLLATRMMGFGYFVAHSEFLKTLAAWPQPTITNSGYPGIKYRLGLVLQHLIDSNACSFGSFLQKYTNEVQSGIDEQVRLLAIGLEKYLSCWQTKLAVTVSDPGISTANLMDALNDFAIRAVEKAYPELVKLAEQAVPQTRCCQMTPRFFDRIRRLAEHLPPSCPHEDETSFAEIAAAAWAYQILFGEEKEIAKGTVEHQNNEYTRICQLVLKAIELIPTGGGDDLPSTTKIGYDHIPPTKSGTLSGPDILERLQLPVGHQQRLSVIPFSTKAVNGASLDVHLGNWFVVARRTRLSSVKLGEEADEQLLMTAGREEQFVPPGHTFLIHPGDFVLGVTLEFIALPPDTMAFVEGRSGLGRWGSLWQRPLRSHRDSTALLF